MTRVLCHLVKQGGEKGLREPIVLGEIRRVSKLEAGRVAKVRENLGLKRGSKGWFRSSV
jgi:hypothetical protein